MNKTQSLNTLLKPYHKKSLVKETDKLLILSESVIFPCITRQATKDERYLYGIKGGKP